MVIYRTAIPLSMTVLISPEVQVMLGNGMGMVGRLFPLCLVLVAALHLLTLQAYDDIYSGRNHISGEYAFLNATFGPWLPLACAPAIMMVTGMAGEETIDVYARVALVFWIIHYSLVHFSVYLKSVVRKGLHLLAGIILAGAALALVLTDPEPIVFLKSIAMIVLVVGAIGLLITHVKKNLIQGG